jgi:SHO1 osmosensor
VRLSANLVQLAWIISFVSSIISATLGDDIRFPNYAWWALVFMFFCIIGVTVTVASGAERTYHVAVSGSHVPTHNRMHLLI